MLCRRISVEGGAEEIVVSSGPRPRQGNGKRSNPYSTSDLDKFESVCAELSAKREYAANKIGVPDAMVRFVSSKNRLIPVVIGGRDQGTGKKTSGGGAAGVLIQGPVEKSDSVNHKQDQHYHHNSKAKQIRRPVPMDNRHNTRPARSVQGSDSFYRRTKAALAYDSRVGATIMIITLFCLVFCGRVYAILLTCSWLYVLPMFREGPGRMREMNRKNEAMKVYLQTSEYKKKVIMDGLVDRRHK